MLIALGHCWNIVMSHTHKHDRAYRVHNGHEDDAFDVSHRHGNQRKQVAELKIRERRRARHALEASVHNFAEADAVLLPPRPRTR